MRQPTPIVARPPTLVSLHRFSVKQILQNTRSGEISVEEVPAPTLQPGRVLVRTAASLISAGTERTAVEDAKKSLVLRAKERPDAVKKVIDRVKSEGLAAAYSAVKAKLGSSVALGYSASGTVISVGADVADLKPGDRVACAGTGYASHAEVLSVPRNLCVRIPGNVSFDDAAFGTLGAIALQGVRLAAPTLGESVVVIGLGLLGQITVQLLKANGCRILGVDVDESKFALAFGSGAEKCATPTDAAALIEEWSRGRGADAVIITAGTSSNQPIELAGEVSRLKGRVVIVGLVEMNVPRADYFKKEISLTVSMSYGPGRYDAEYEERGHDYPVGYVRWTEGRNIEALLDLVASGSVDVKKLVTHRFSIDKGRDAYAVIGGEKHEPYVGVLLEYDQKRDLTPQPRSKRIVGSGDLRIGLIGAGDYARAMLLPHFKNERAEFIAVATASGVTAINVASQFGFAETLSSADEIISDSGVNAVVIATRHDTHASYAAAALRAGKHVFVEKPLALNESDLAEVIAAVDASSGSLTVGFNRRFSPAARAAKQFFADSDDPVSIVCRVNAGRIPREHWVHDPIQGGGRIIGEVCHFIDLMQFLTGASPIRVYAESLTSRNAAAIDDDSVSIALKFTDGSIATMAYFAEGDKAMPKERLEIFGGGRSFVIDDFRETRSYVLGKEATKKLGRQDKGQRDEVVAFCKLVREGGEPLIPLDVLAATTRATFRIVESLRLGRPLSVTPEQSDDPSK
jgi:predicted dehydrogenase/threonine dehydrogenase-like Zn-dependent dehydrogenase